MRVPLEWLKAFVPIRLKAERLASALTMAGLEVEAVEQVGSDVIFEVGVTPNRADCLSVVGIAREIAAVTGAKLSLPAPKAPKGEGRMGVRVQVRHPKRCPRYAARVIQGVRVGPAPAWIVKRLAACGVRSINNIVDATNFVMLETGQPLHAFDLRFIRDGRIVVRMAGEPMAFGTLDGTVRQLSPEDLLICDGRGPVALAGIMGGENSEVRSSTTAVLLESACFEPRGIRRTSRRLGLTSESSLRFQRGVDPNGTAAALHRLTEIIVETAGGVPSADQVDVSPRRIGPRRVRFSPEEANRILGTDCSAARMGTLLSRLGLGVRRMGGALSVTVPTFRPDLQRPIDLIEEVARIGGYSAIPETMPVVTVAPLSRPRFFEEERRVREALVQAGLSESVLYGFTSEEALAPFGELGRYPVAITNPLTAEQGVMCTTLLPGLLDALRVNASRQRPGARLFALQHVFQRPMAMGPSDEPRRVAGVMSGERFPGGWERAREEIDFYDAKGVAEAVLEALRLGRAAIFQRGEAHRFLHPGTFAYVIVNSRRAGFVGQLHPDVAARWELKQKVFVFEMHFELLGELGAAESRRYAEPSRFPFVERDLAIVVSERIPAVEVEKAILDSGVDLVRVRIFDVYRGEGLPAGHKSVGVTLTFTRSDRTLTDEEVAAAQARIVGALKGTLGAELRT